MLSLFRKEFNKFNYTRARKLDSIYHMTLLLNLISVGITYQTVLIKIKLGILSHLIMFK